MKKENLCFNNGLRTMLNIKSGKPWCDPKVGKASGLDIGLAQDYLVS